VGRKGWGSGGWCLGWVVWGGDGVSVEGMLGLEVCSEWALTCGIHDDMRSREPFLTVCGVSLGRMHADMDGLLPNYCKCCELIERRFGIEVRVDFKRNSIHLER
jgi:hypothetical protein